MNPRIDDSTPLGLAAWLYFTEIHHTDSFSTFNQIIDARLRLTNNYKTPHAFNFKKRTNRNLSLTLSFYH
ncbi:MAG: hypothetical protein OXE77_00825 [Flavobacteriaceae bacterium]|nr:hypothetical protein [Flavobacteriaceae bacterium]MCY4299213.1 hypothetical protein [Flavobacteriaceae bacterium]